jgi:peptidoglycan hydrolase-like protein with peptidoglycan-binding domain
VRNASIGNKLAGAGAGIIAEGAARWFLLRRLGWSYRDVAGALLAMAATGAILVNTLFLQTGPHPAPIFTSAVASDAVELKDASVGAVQRPREPAKSETAKSEPAPKKPEPGAVGAAPNKTEPSRVVSEVIADIQRELARRGFYEGTVDGVVGSRTGTAIRAFEQAAGIKVHEEPGAGLLRAIKASNAKGAKAPAAGTPVARAVAPPNPTPPASVPMRGDPINDALASSKRVVAVQRALADYGYGQIRPTGMLDRETKAAIERFERERKLPVTGAANDRVVRELAAVTGRQVD